MQAPCQFRMAAIAISPRVAVTANANQLNRLAGEASKSCCHFDSSKSGIRLAKRPSLDVKLAVGEICRDAAILASRRKNH